MERINALSEKCVMQVLESIRDSEIKDKPAADVLLSVGTAVMGNLIMGFINTVLTDAERHKACNVFLQAIGGQVSNNFDRIFGVKAASDIAEKE